MAAEVSIVRATREHAIALAPTMRKADAAEVWASGRYSPQEALLESLRASAEAYTLLIDGEPAVMWGVVPLPTRTLLAPPAGAVWLLGGEAVTRHKRLFLRLSRVGLARLLERYPVLVNAVDARYVQAVRWLRWLGFTVGEAQPFGVAGLPFHPISIRSVRHV